MVRKVCVGLAGISFNSSFWGFKESQYKERISKLRKTVEQLGSRFVAIPKTFCNAKGAVAAAKKLNDKADIIILDVATYPEGKAAGVFFDTIKSLLILWSRRESVHKANLGHNSFCGANFLASNLALRDQHFRTLYGPVTSKDFRSRLQTAVRLIGAAKAVSGSKIGIFGEGIVPKFYDIDISVKDREKLESRWGIRFVGVPIERYVKLAKSYKNSDISKMSKRFCSGFSDIKVEDREVEKLVRLVSAIKEITSKEGLASIAVRCWPELQQVYGVWPCSSLSFLNDAGIPAACEGDPAGALDMLLAKQLSKKPSTLMDIVDWDDKKNNFSIWHCGPTACSWADKCGAILVPHTVAGATRDGKAADGLAGAVKMQFASGKVTVFRTLGAIDDEFVVQGKLIQEPSRRIYGSFGIVGSPTVYANNSSVNILRQDILNRRIPHHFAASHGHLFY